MFTIHEFSSRSGQLSSVYLRSADSALEIVAEDGTWPLPDGVLAAVFKRYGAPFDPEARSSLIANLQLGDGECVRHVRHLAGYDVIARDYLVYEQPKGEALCALAATVAAALLHLARAQAARG